MKKLLKQYGFTERFQYFEMILESVINGQITQSKNQFLAMPKKDRLDFIFDNEVNLTIMQREAFKMLVL